jgi:integrase
VDELSPYGVKIRQVEALQERKLDLRRTFATNLAQLGVAPHVIERLLNHVTGQISGVAAIYNRAKYFDEMAQAMQQWEARLVEILND